MDISSKNLRENKEVCVLLIPLVTVLGKLIEHLFLPTKYYYDNIRVLNMMLYEDYKDTWEGSYRVASNFFTKINWFDFTTLFQWSIFLGLICNIVLMIMISKIKIMNIQQAIFTLMSIGLCNIYVINIGKDFIQVLLFMLCYIIISIKNIPSWLKVILCAAIFYWESTFFRNYYIIVSVFILVVYVMFWILRKTEKKIKVKHIVLIILLLFGVMYVFLSVAKVVSYEDFQEIMECKDASTQLGANSTIDDKIAHGENVNLFMENYIINSVRLLFPIEMAKEGVGYIPFFVLQIFLLYFLVRCLSKIRSINEENVIGLCIYISYFMCSVLFEPDFGSFARHESGTLPILILFIANNQTLALGKVQGIEESYE